MQTRSGGFAGGSGSHVKRAVGRGMCTQIWAARPGDVMGLLHVW